MRSVVTITDQKVSSEDNLYDCIIIGGGIAGLQAAIQLGRYMHRVLVIDGGDGRSVRCQCYHNLLGWPSGVSGPTLRELGRQQALAYGVEFQTGWVNQVTLLKGESHQEQALSDTHETMTPAVDAMFRVGTTSKIQVQARRILFATGLVDHLPDWPHLGPCLGVTVYVCPDCDGYEVRKRKTVVVGRGDSGVEMAKMLLYFTRDLIYVNDSKEGLPRELLQQLTDQQIEVIESTVNGLDVSSESVFIGVELQDGRIIRGERAFLAYGGNKVQSHLAATLSIPLLPNQHIDVNPRTKETSVRHVYAAGDVTAHSEQVSIAMGDGAQAAIWIHKSLLSSWQG